MRSRSVATTIAAITIVLGCLHYIYVFKWHFEPNEQNDHLPHVPRRQYSYLAHVPRQQTLTLDCSEGWYHRLGNNIVSVVHAAVEAYSMGLEFALRNCSHPVLNLNHFSTLGREVFCPIVLSPSSAFRRFVYPINKALGMQYILPPFLKCLRHAIVRPMIQHMIKEVTKLGREYLVIHFRSGDVFVPPSNPFYAPPPLQFYVDIIESDKWGHIAIVAEQPLSPIASKLIETYPFILLQSGRLEDDVSTIVQATHLVISQSTFAWALALGSIDLRTLYTFNNTLQILDNAVFGGVTVVEYRVVDTYITAWNASAEHVNFVLNFPRSSLTKRVFTVENTCQEN